MHQSKSTGWLHFFTTWHHKRATPCAKFKYKNGSNFHENCNLFSACSIQLQPDYQFDSPSPWNSELSLLLSYQYSDIQWALNLQVCFVSLKTSNFIQIFILRYWKCKFNEITENFENETKALPTNCLQQMQKNCLWKLFRKTCQTMQASFGSWRLLWTNKKLQR